MSLSHQLREDIQELTRLASLVTEAHTAAIFVPNEASIDLVAFTSEASLVKNARIQVGHGLLGWVAQHGKSIHLAPCDISSSAIGIYVDQEPVKSLAAVAITPRHTTIADQRPHLTQTSNTGDISSSPFGVLMCDSVSPTGFSNKEIRILEQIARSVEGVLSWSVKADLVSPVETSWDLFKQATSDLGDAIGHDSIELLRMSLESLEEIESTAGVSLAVQVSEQFTRLTQQALPPHFPYSRLPNGDLVIAVDNMMSPFFQQKLQSLANHLSSTEKPVRVSIESYRAKLGAGGRFSIDLTLRQQPVSVKNSVNLGGARA
jgi:hypothetical protein